MRLCSLVFAVLATLGLALPAQAQRGGHGGSHSSSRSRSSGSVHVHGYTGRSGKSVAPYTRRAPGEVTHSAPRASTVPHVAAPHSPHLSTGSPQATPPKAARIPNHSAAPGTTRSSNSRIKRSEAAKDQFLRQTGHPHGWPGHVVDHVVPLACGGADAPSNMQWQTVAEAKAKDRVEQRGCSRNR